MKPLEGIKVVELTGFYAAPTVPRVLAEWGAEVIKIEPPIGDPAEHKAEYLICLTVMKRIQHLILPTLIKNLFVLI